MQITEFDNLKILSVCSVFFPLVFFQWLVTDKIVQYHRHLGPGFFF